MERTDGHYESAMVVECSARVASTQLDLGKFVNRHNDMHVLIEKGLQYGKENVPHPEKRAQ